MNLYEQQLRFTEWTRDHGPILHHVVNGFASGANRDDLMQEVLLAVWKAVPAFRGQAKPTTYLYRVCHNAALLWIRTEKNYRRRVERYGKLSAGPDPEAEEQADDRLARIYAALHQLKPLDRSLMLLALDGLSYREMAEVLGLSESNVGVKLNRIKTQLTHLLKGDTHEPR